MSTSDFRISQPGSGDPLVGAVIALSKHHQSLLGQLGYQVFHDSAGLGCLLVAEMGSSVAGYVLFRRRRRDRAVMLVHLCVAESSQRLGVARSLVDEVAVRNPAASGIGAWCRSDYAATAAWPRLGFDRGVTKPGKARSRTQLVHWWRPVADRSLLICEPDPDGIPTAALDTDIFRDLKEPRHEFVESHALAAGWLADEVEFVVTGHVAAEIDAASTLVPALRGTSNSFRRLSSRPEDWEPVRSLIDAHVTDKSVGDGDRRHVAQAAAAGATFVVTRDEALLAASTRIEQVAGVQVLRPSQLLVQLHAGLETVAYQTAALYGTSWTIGPSSEAPSKEQLRRFVGPDERLTHLAMRVNSTLAEVADGARLWAITRDRELIAFATCLPDGNDFVVTALRVVSSVPQRTFCRHMADSLRRHASRHGFQKMRIDDALPPYADRALRDEGFQVGPDGWWASTTPGLLAADDTEPIAGRLVGDLTPTEALELETQVWPTRVITGSTPTYVVPIRPGWALELLGASNSTPSLLPRPDSLGAAREHVYYRSPIRSLEAPARVLWYVSGGGAEGGFRAVSWLTAVVTAGPKSLFRRFGPRGVYSETDVLASASPAGLATAMLFTRTELLERPITLREARGFYSQLSQTGFLRSTRRIDEHTFVEICRRGFPA